MGLRTAAEYRAGLIDGRRVFYRGERVTDVVRHPELAPAVDHSAHCFSIAAERPDLAVRKSNELGEYSGFYHLPCSAEDLRLRAELIEEVSRRGAGTIVLKEVGSDALFASLGATEGEGREAARAFYRRWADRRQGEPVSGPVRPGRSGPLPARRRLRRRLDHGARCEDAHLVLGERRRDHRVADTRHGPGRRGLCGLVRSSGRHPRAVAVRVPVPRRGGRPVRAAARLDTQAAGVVDGLRRRPGPARTGLPRTTP